MADDRRPQADRDPLHLHLPRLLRARRGAGAADPHPARDAGRVVPDEELLQPGGDDPRHDDDLPRHHPDPRRLRELPGAAADRRAGHGVPASERALVLALPARRDRPVRELLREGRRGRERLDRVHAAVDAALARERPGLLDPRSAHPLDRVTRRCDQLRRDHPQHAHPGHVVDAHPALLLDDGHVRLDARDRPAGAVRRPDADAARPPGRNPLLRPGARWQSDPLSARLLVLRPPRGLHHDPAGDGDHLRGATRLRAQADLRLQGGRNLDGRNRVLLDARLGAPHVRGRVSRSGSTSSSWSARW